MKSVGGSTSGRRAERRAPDQKLSCRMLKLHNLFRIVDMGVGSAEARGMLIPILESKTVKWEDNGGRRDGESDSGGEIKLDPGTS